MAGAFNHFQGAHHALRISNFSGFKVSGIPEFDLLLQPGQSIPGDIVPGFLFLSVHQFRGSYLILHKRFNVQTRPSHHHNHIPV